jgi:hypothetical protein
MISVVPVLGFFPMSWVNLDTLLPFALMGEAFCVSLPLVPQILTTIFLSLTVEYIIFYKLKFLLTISDTMRHKLTIDTN